MSRFLLLAVLVLGGCSWFRDEPETYGKPGASQEQVSADVESCRQQARAVQRRDAAFDQEIANLSDEEDQAGADDDAQFTRNLQEYGANRRYHDLVSDCMRNLGYGAGSTGGY